MSKSEDRFFIVERIERDGDRFKVTAKVDDPTLAKRKTFTAYAPSADTFPLGSRVIVSTTVTMQSAE